MAWTDEEKQTAIDMYIAAEPTADNSTEIVAEIGQKMGQSPNGVRMILTKATHADGSKVYIAKTPAAKSAAGGTTTAAAGDKAPRVSKEAAHAALTSAIEAVGGTADQEIISKLTGKAAQYFTGVFAAVSSDN